MRILVTGSAGHLGEALMRTLQGAGRAAIGLDIKSSPFTQRVGSIIDRDFVAQCLRGVDAVVHAATLHKPHIASHTRQQFIDTNVTGTLNLLEAAVAAGVKSFVFTSTTSAFGRALSPPAGAPAAWITEEVVPQPKNIYGVTKLAAENLCELFSLTAGLPCIILRTSRFFPENDDDADSRRAYDDANLKVNEFLYRRADLEDVVSAHLLSVERAPAIGFARFIISATTPFARDDLALLRVNAAAVVKRHVPAYQAEYQRRGWSMAPCIDRVYVNELARSQLGWRPRYDFAGVLQCLIGQRDFRSPLARAIGSKGYHDKSCTEWGSAGPYPLNKG
ncbi:MAG TPA: NAD(P)-dependent oxidoreductase [Steroidobacteraceae bacterium]|jgi:UDP-glucose 4-epimerase|nr:NAD(P)-dependent oxidoreductase [Steroidobacteraceae bacterium]